MNRLALLALVLVLGGCAVANKLDELPELGAGKADGSLSVEIRDGLTIGIEEEGYLVEGRAHQWTFELTETAVVSFETSGTIDTILYLHDSEGELAVDDDGGEGLSSSLNIPLGPGQYQVTATLYAGSPEGVYTLHTSCLGGCAASATDPWAVARDVNLHHVEFTDATPIPESYARAVGISPVGFSAPEWWQRWPGGETQSFSWSAGSPYGQRCAQAAAVRLEAIIAYEAADEDGHLPGAEAFQDLIVGSTWRGSMSNWTEDVSEGGHPSFSLATMWAHADTVEFINVVHPDGSCDLPTLELVERFSEICLRQADLEDGAIEGCSVSAE